MLHGNLKWDLIQNEEANDEHYSRNVVTTIVWLNCSRPSRSLDITSTWYDVIGLSPWTATAKVSLGMTRTVCQSDIDSSSSRYLQLPQNSNWYTRSRLQTRRIQKLFRAEVDMGWVDQLVGLGPVFAICVGWVGLIFKNVSHWWQI